MPSAELTTLAESLGWTVRRGRIDSTDDKADYLARLGAIAGVPDYVRPNWDAMADGLRDAGIQNHRLLVIETEQAMRFDATAIEVLDEAAAFWRAQAATMQVVWFGPIDAPELDQIEPVRRSRSRHP